MTVSQRMGIIQCHNPFCGKQYAMDKRNKASIMDTATHFTRGQKRVVNLDIS